jgi:hypothetical protein
VSGGEPPDPRDRTNLVVVLVVLAVIAVGGFLMYLLKQNLDLQKCEMERRMDCHAIAIPDQQNGQSPPT